MFQSLVGQEQELGGLKSVSLYVTTSGKVPINKTVIVY